MPDSRGTDARDDRLVWNSWYPLGVPGELRKHNRPRTWLLDREITLSFDDTTVAARCDGRALPMEPSLGYLWTTLGEPAQPPPSVPECAEPDRIALNIWSTPIACSGLRIVDNVIDNAHFPFVHPGILGDRAHLELPPYENRVDESGALWSLRHQAWLPLSGSVAEYTYWIPTPYAVMLLIHRPPVPGSTAIRYDYLGVFAQPTGEESFVAHKLLAWVREAGMTERQVRSDQQWISVQDKYVLERHDPKKLPLDGDLETSVSVDSASVAYRAWLRERGVRYGALYSGHAR
jgi:phenylpropionate dioxygenase-like ring-hydroxylating dioxygenase large terminal subunit